MHVSGLRSDWCVNISVCINLDNKPYQCLTLYIDCKNMKNLTHTMALFGRFPLIAEIVPIEIQWSPPRIRGKVSSLHSASTLVLITSETIPTWRQFLALIPWFTPKVSRPKFVSTATGLTCLTLQPMSVKTFWRPPSKIALRYISNKN